MQLRDYFDRLACVFVLAAIGIVLALSIGPAVSRWHHRQAVERLAAQIEVSADAEVKIPLRQIAAYDLPAIDTLVLAAASPREAVADLARKILAEKLANWQLRVQASADVQSSTAIAKLADSLHQQIDQFGYGGKQWAEKLALRMILLSDNLAIPNSGRLLSDCNGILEAIPPQGPRMRSLATGTEGTIKDAPVPSLPPMPLDVLAVPSERALEVESADVPLSPHVFENQLSELASPIYAPKQSADASWLPQWENTQPLELQPQVSAPLPLETNEPVASLPAVPVEPVVDVPNPSEMRKLLKQFQGIASEVLLEKLPTVGFYEAGAMREILRKRGYNDAELAIIQRISSREAAQRLSVIDDLSQLSAGQARRWLRRLLKDKNADVRYRALSAIATTNEPQLYDLAKEMALTDRDSRIAKLAARIMRQKR